MRMLVRLALLTGAITTVSQVIGCSVTNRATTAAITASDIRYVLEEYPRTTERLGQIELSDNEREGFNDILSDLDESYEYFKGLTPSNIDANRVVREYTVAKESYLALRYMVVDVGIEDPRLRLELEDIDNLVHVIDQNIAVLLETPEDLDSTNIKSLLRTLTTLTKIMV